MNHVQSRNQIYTRKTKLQKFRFITTQRDIIHKGKVTSISILKKGNFWIWSGGILANEIHHSDLIVTFLQKLNFDVLLWGNLLWDAVQQHVLFFSVDWECLVNYTGDSCSVFPHIGSFYSSISTFYWFSKDSPSIIGTVLIFFFFFSFEKFYASNFSSILCIFERKVKFLLQSKVIRGWITAGTVRTLLLFQRFKKCKVIPESCPRWKKFSCTVSAHEWKVSFLCN